MTKTRHEEILMESIRRYGDEILARVDELGYLWCTECRKPREGDEDLRANNSALDEESCEGCGRKWRLGHLGYVYPVTRGAS